MENMVKYACVCVCMMGEGECVRVCMGVYVKHLCITA